MHLSVLALALVVSVSPFAVEAQPAAAQQPTKIARLGYLTNDTVAVDLPRRNAFKQGLRDRAGPRKLDRAIGDRTAPF